MKKISIGISALTILIVLIILFKFIIIPNSKNNTTPTPEPKYYQNLKTQCNLQTDTLKNCCLDSVKAMEVVGGVLFPQKNVDGCKDNYKRMTLRCPGSLAWCQTDPDNGINDTITPPVPQDTPQINPGVICTADTKQCPDGTYVGRTGPECKFSACPGKPLTPDFIPTEDNPIQLPDNVISEKDCATQGGEVWNTLGETSYNGELIGKIEGLLCPCACLVKSEESNILWVNINGNLEEFKGDINKIKTFDDCKNAGFKIKNGTPEICQVGESHMTHGKYKTFYNHPWGSGKTCIDYHYSNCPGSCVPTCTSSSCSASDKTGAITCTSDCDGPKSCTEK